MKIAAVIPSRYQSSRFPGKPLAVIRGMSMLERVYRQVEKCGRFSDILVATDDERILAEVQRFAGRAVMTDNRHTSGTERLWEVIEKSDFAGAVNIQGDEPAIPPQLIAALYDELERGQYPVVTAAYLNDSLEDFQAENVVKVVLDRNLQALYFSRSPVPFIKAADFKNFYQHLGIYGYSREALKTFVKSPGAESEKREKLEQLRFLENGIPIKVILSQEKSHGVDVPGDISRIEKILDEQNG